MKNFAFAERQPEVDAVTSKQIEAGHPHHTGPVTTGQTGMHTYRASKFIVEIKTTTNAARIEQVFVEDINKDSILDSVWVNDYGTWRFASTLGPDYRLIRNTASKKLLKDYLNLAGDIRRNIKVQEEKERAQRAREQALQKSKKLEEDAHKWRNRSTNPSDPSDEGSQWNKTYIPQNQARYLKPN